MKKANATSVGCLTGMAGLVLVIAAASFVSSYLYNAPFRYETVNRISSPNISKYAHQFINTGDTRAHYTGVSLSRNKRLNRDYKNEVLSISPANALATMDLVWIDNFTLEIKFCIDPSVKARIGYGKAPQNLLRSVIFTEVVAEPEP